MLITVKIQTSMHLSLSISNYVEDNKYIVNGKKSFPLIRDAQCSNDKTIQNNNEDDEQEIYLEIMKRCYYCVVACFETNQENMKNQNESIMICKCEVECKPHLKINFHTGPGRIFEGEIQPL